jgi:hypothetical protein
MDQLRFGKPSGMRFHPWHRAPSLRWRSRSSTEAPNWRTIAQDPAGRIDSWYNQGSSRRAGPLSFTVRRPEVHRWRRCRNTVSIPSCIPTC